MLSAALALSLAAQLVAAVPAQGPVSIPIAKKVIPGASPEAVRKISTAHTMSKYIQPGDGERSDTPLTNVVNFLYTCNVTVGNGQVLSLDLDTGSSDTWVRGKGCSSTDGSCDPDLQYVDATDASLKRIAGKTYSVQYGSGSVKGDIYNAPVAIGGLTAHYPIGISTEETGFSEGGITGLVGMGYNSISQIASSVGSGTNANFFDSLGFTGSQNQFSFYLGNYPAGGELTLGGVNPARYTGAMTYVPLNSETYFQFSLSGWTYKAGANSGNVGGSFFGNNGIADTGSTLLLFNSAKVADAVNAGLGAGKYNSTLGAYPIDCAKASTGAPFVLNYNSVSFSIPASIYVLDNGDGTCVSGISQFTQFGAPTIFGDTFLRAYYTVFDKANKRLGFAKAV
ncbi:hypothetical protein HDV03_000895 [Kappamyces sp. JEL0829]|nr:hypothetical protein HDV03_000895 [Kappamyces sp. JEL0829]KAJ3347161.1 hypothetical protein HDU91_006840 [Kappamyces sp. JEL0680]